jgi:hypothetical protein
VEPSCSSWGSLTPDNRQTSVSRKIAPMATFSDERDPASLTTSVKLYRWNVKKLWQRVPATMERQLEYKPGGA